MQTFTKIVCLISCKIVAMKCFQSSTKKLNRKGLLILVNVLLMKYRSVWLFGCVHNFSVSPGKSLSPRGKSRHRSCSLWYGSSSSTSTGERWSRPQTSVQVTDCSCWATSHPSHWPCTESVRSKGVSPGLAKRQAGLWHWWQLDGLTERHKGYALQSVNIISKLWRWTCTFTIYIREFLTWAGSRGFFLSHRNNCCLPKRLRTHENGIKVLHEQNTIQFNSKQFNSYSVLTVTLSVLILEPTTYVKKSSEQGFSLTGGWVMGILTFPCSILASY